MKAALLILIALSAISLTLPGQRAPRTNPGMGPLLEQAEIKPGDPIPEDLSLYTADGEPVALAALGRGKFTVLVSGCLTCPIFHRTYPGVEAVYADYKSSDQVQFFYMYKSLAHPEFNGYVQPVTLEERLAHVEEAKRVLGTTLPWLCDGVDNRVRHALGFGPNTQIIIDPEGVLVHALDWSDGEVLRTQLTALVGPTETVTTVADLELERGQPYRRQRSYEQGPLEKPSFDSELVAVKVEPKDNGKSPFYVKPRVEVDPTVLRDGQGELYLGFFLDPIHHVHWNNLADPLEYEFILPDGSVLTPRKGVAPRVEQETDSFPREFALNVSELDASQPAQLAIRYYACSDEEGWCRAVTQSYTVSFTIDPDGGGTNGRSFAVRNRRQDSQGPARGGPRGPGARSQPNAQQIKERVMASDANGDGKVTLEELPEQMKRRFNQMDANGDGFVEESEIEAMLRNRFRGAAPPSRNRNE